MTGTPPPGPAEAQQPAAPRTGLVFCRCGPNLGTLVQLGALEAPAHWPEAADVVVHPVLCSAEGQAWLAARVQALGLERLVVAACSPREHEQTFRGVMTAAGRSPWLVQLVNLREQVEWIGGAAADATARAARLVRAGLARVALHRPIAAREVEVSADVVVVGGGAAGVSAALALARKDRRVVLVERAPALGGLANRLDEIFPDLACASCFMEPALDEVLHHERIEVLTSAEVVRVRGSAGRFEVEVAQAPRFVDPAACVGCDRCASVCPADRPDPWSGGLGRARAIGLAYPGCLPHVSALDQASCLRSHGQACELCQAGCAFGAIDLGAAPRRRTVTAGAVVVATGMEPGAVAGPPGLVSTYQLERMLHPSGPTGGALRAAGGAAPRTLLLATSAAETDGELAVRELLKLAHLVRTRHPEVEVSVAGGLGRAPGYAAAARQAEADGVELLEADLVPGTPLDAGGAVAVRLAQGALETARTFDLVVLHGPATPAAGSQALAALLRLPLGPRGFVEEGAASPFEPTATRLAGIFVAGAAAGPRPIRQAIRDGTAAAGRVLATLVPGERRVVEPLAAEVDAALCGACGACVSACPYGAVVRSPEGGKAEVEPLHCHGCGTCAAACPTGAASAAHFTRAQLGAEISALLRGPGGGADR
ncbi:MAG: CoB--CoM heterodisulfide reductase iron-sulfur subunit A family protein [Anaeromyxobacter sp.]|nr:CoB--CoM heterodisulfide reductase iron-sulfur subunit A family protein [Anaeromyxobacter sp.]MBL0277058.1 CoB--CoM heterodisulfide reductase iron-sulfur subunit A family protein [Anaeromyxobacter sp.]